MRLLSLLFLALTPTLLLADDTLTGTWKLTGSSGRSSRHSIVKLKQDGTKLTGVMLHYLGHRSPIADGSIEEDRVVFRVTQSRSGETSQTEYSGVFRDGRIEGTTEYRRRGRARTVNWVAERTHDTPLAPQPSEAPPVEADIDLSDSNYQVWRDHILPDHSEMAWTQIPWFSTLKDGILAADAASKPLLFWTMNGHPLGCT